jgi:hypothetical protein
VTQPGAPPQGSPSAPPSGEGPPADPRIGATFGKYKIIRLLGRGGMGAVYEGEDAALKRKVAVKFLPDELVNKPEVIERFMREAQVAGGINHPNIIAVYDVGKDERGCYMVMELLHPKSASSRIKSEGPYHWLVATRIIADCAAALSIAHQNGIIHRDIKPDQKGSAYCFARRGTSSAFHRPCGVSCPRPARRARKSAIVIFADSRSFGSIASAACRLRSSFRA